MAAKHEIENFIISSAAIVVAIYSTLVAISSGFTHHLGKLVDGILIQLGLVPWQIVNKLNMSKSLSYSYVSVNEAVFILINIFAGFITFKLIFKRGTKFSGFIYGISMTLIFLLVASILTIQSGDPFNWICVLFGIPVTLFIQILLATVVFKRSKPKKSLQ